MKIIAISNYNNESVSDYLVAENVLPGCIKIMCKALNDNPNQTFFFKAVEDDHVLYEFQP